MNYDWKYCSIGGVTRVKIESGEDIAHLGILDKKLWTALSCPVEGLEFDPVTLSYLDADSDGHIRADEVVAAAEYLAAVVKDNSVLAEGRDSFSIDDIDTSTPEGAALAKAFTQPVMSLPDVPVVEVDRFLHLLRDIFKFVENYVIFADLYAPDPERRAVFEAGDLYVDGRCCNLCIKVTDMEAHADMAALSGMFLLYCQCSRKAGDEPFDIVSVMTEGDIANLRPGKRGIFYDRAGRDYDAVITRIVDNPISIRQAFWSPYRRFWEFCKNLINKSATEKDSKIMADLQQKALDAAAKPKKEAFDIAKFAGIFAALGMAIGFISQALVALVAGISRLKFWQFVVIVAILMLLVSGPACLIAWSKLRKRNLGPVLNAGGWAINSVVLVNIPFGNTLTSVAKYPKLRLEDPYKEKVPAWKKAVCWAVVLIVIAFGVLFFTGNLEPIGLSYHSGDVGRALQSVSEEFHSGIQGAIDAGTAAADSLKAAQADTI